MRRGRGRGKLHPRLLERNRKFVSRLWEAPGFRYRVPRASNSPGKQSSRLKIRSPTVSFGEKIMAASQLTSASVYASKALKSVAFRPLRRHSRLFPIVLIRRL